MNHSLKNSRQTTYQSLCAFVALLFAETKEDFVANYKKASHEDAGEGIWYYVDRGQKEHLHRYYVKKKEAKCKKN